VIEPIDEIVDDVLGGDLADKEYGGYLSIKNFKSWRDN